MANNSEQFKIYLGVALDKKGKTTLEEEIKLLSKQGIDLKVGIDENSLKAITKSIDGITDQLKKMGTLSNQAGKSVASGFDQAEKKFGRFRGELNRITDEYKKGQRSAKEYSDILSKMFKLDSGQGLSQDILSRFDANELDEYLKIITNVKNTVRSIEPIGSLIKTEEVSLIKGQTAELVRQVKTYSDDMGRVQTISSVVNKQTGELVGTKQKLITKEEYALQLQKQQELSIEKQKTALQNLGKDVQKINSFGIDMIKGGNATSKDNDMINKANQIKKEHQELIKLNNDNVLIDELRIQKFKTLIAEQKNLINAKQAEISKDKELEKLLYDRDKTVKEMRAKVSKSNQDYSTGVDSKESEAIEKMIKSYSKLNPLKENMKIKTDELTSSIDNYIQKVKESATQEQKEYIAKEKQAIAIQKLQSAFSNTNKKYAFGVDDKSSNAMKDQIKALEMLDPLTDEYTVSLEKARFTMSEYTKEARANAQAFDTQHSSLLKLNKMQDSLDSVMKANKGNYDVTEAKGIQQTINQMRDLILQGQDVKLLFGTLGNSLQQFSKKSKEATKESKKSLKEEQDLYLFKKKALFDLNKLENEYNKRGMSTQKIRNTREAVEKLGVETKATTFEIKKLQQEIGEIKGLASMQALNKSMSSILQTATGFYGLYSVFGYLKEGFRSLVGESLALDSAMIGLKRVTDETSASYELFKQKAFDTANEIGGSAKEIIDSTAEFAKLGYSFEEAGKLAESATKYATVGEISLTEATNALTASYTVFGNTFDETMGRIADSSSIIDLYNEVGNRMSVTSSDIGEALKASANSLSVANNSLSESVTLIATANKTVQDSSKVGNALRTISMRLRGIDSETGELIPKMRELIQSATGGKVDIMDGEEFKSTYQIMLEISNIWDELSDKQRAYLSEAIAGKNRVTYCPLYTVMCAKFEVKCR